MILVLMFCFQTGHARSDTMTSRPLILPALKAFPPP